MAVSGKIHLNVGKTNQARLIDILKEYSTVSFYIRSK